MNTYDFSHLWDWGHAAFESEGISRELEWLFIQVVLGLREIEKETYRTGDEYDEMEKIVTGRLKSLIQHFKIADQLLSNGDKQGALIVFNLGTILGNLEATPSIQDALKKGEQKGLNTPKPRNRPNLTRDKSFELFNKDDAAGRPISTSSIAKRLSKDVRIIQKYKQEWERTKAKLN